MSSHTPSTPRSVGRTLLVVALLAIAVYYAVWGGEYSVWDLRRIAARQEAEAARIEVVRAEVDSLRQLASRLESDPATLEAVARERFGMIRDGEVLFRFVQVDSAVTAPAESGGSGTGP